MNEDILPLAAVKARLSEVIDRIEARHERVTVTRNGRPAAVLVSPDDLAALEDSLEILSNPAALEEIQKARQDLARGKGLTADDLRAKYLKS